MRLGRSIQYSKLYVYRFPIYSIILFFALLNIVFLIFYLVTLENQVINFNVWKLQSRVKENYKNKQKDDAKREFKIDYDKNEFIKDGKVFRYISGSFHYFRANRPYWRDRIIKMRAAGLNAISTYVEWSSHEPSPGKFDFSGDLDLEYFLTIAHEEGMLVLLRPGPYVCAERDFGGLPYWLLSDDQNLPIRTSDQRYVNAVKRWYDKLLPMMEKYLYGNGGPIILVQVENEYGSYPACDSDHMIWLRDLTKSYVKNNSVLFTTDGAGDNYLRCGAIPGVYATVDFGTDTNVDANFAAMRRYSPNGPLVNSEFYPGWLSHWGENLSTISIDPILKSMDKFSYYNASYNFYMFYGGTNFGFTAGANYDKGRYLPQLTSYDYNAPLDEAGDPTEKYFAIRNYLKKIVNIVDVAPVRSPKGNYGSVKLKAKVSLFDKNNIPDKTSVQSIKPLTFEKLNQSFGFVLYETIIPNYISDPVLNITDVRDRAFVYLNQRSVGVLTSSGQSQTMSLTDHSGQLLSILVENQGRINYGSAMIDPKGILSDVYIGAHVLTSWNMTGFPLKTVDWLSHISTASDIKPPAFYQGQFVLPESTTVALDTYLDPSGWTKGVAFINGFNLGRYWPTVGPQVTLYVPKCHLKLYPQINVVTLFELENASPTLDIKFVDTPILNATSPVYYG